ncbi:MAG: hypothetical protein K0B15_05515 [Lentimicrobium sp.]|nr:hypothetical protein [Lentimicrobium sp.]
MNLIHILPFLLIISLTTKGQPVPAKDARFSGKHCLNKTEELMAQALNQYRKKQGLKPIPLSASLSWVARTHAADLLENYKYGTSCNLHSWSDNKYWSSCCYTKDHKQAACMWDKPRELTNYSGDGFEIAFYSTQEYPDAISYIEDALNGWKASRGHHDVLANQGKWKNVKWQAMGIGANEEFILVWFGEEKDLTGTPEFCP